MALPPLASTDDLEQYSGMSVDPGRATAILAAASTLVRAYTSRTWVGADGEWETGVSEVHQDIVKTVTLTVADRVYRNPTGASQEAVGPFSRSVAAWAAFGMFLTDEEKELLPTGSGVSGLSSVRVLAPALAAGVPRRAPWWTQTIEIEDEGS